MEVVPLWYLSLLGAEERDVLVASIVISERLLVPLHGHRRYRASLRKMNLEV